MKIHNITKDDMLNGDGLRIVLWVAGCEHHCQNCQNPITWDPDGGSEFTPADFADICKELEKNYISGITFSGGDPLYPGNRNDIETLTNFIKGKYPEKTIWIYTGYTYEQLDAAAKEDYTVAEILYNTDVLVDGPYVEALRDVTLHWKGSSNQRVIDVQKTINSGSVVLIEDDTDFQRIYQNGKRGCGE